MVCLDLLLVFNVNPCAVDEIVFLFLPSRLVNNGDHGVPVQDRNEPLLILDGIKVYELHEPRVLGSKHGLFNDLCRRSADMERSHRKLRAGLTD